MIFEVCFEKTGGVLQKREMSCKKWGFCPAKKYFRLASMRL